MTPFQILSFFIGGIALSVGFWSLQSPETAQRFSKSLPRNVWIGRVLLLIDMGWSLFLLNKMSLGDWDRLKPYAYALSPVVYWFIITYVNNYLGARSVGLFLILVAKPVLFICFLSESPWSVVGAALAYCWVVIGICIVAVPHWMRDLTNFWCATPKRWTLACGLRMVLGVFLIFIGFIGK